RCGLRRSLRLGRLLRGLLARLRLDRLACRLLGGLGLRRLLCSLLLCSLLLGRHADFFLFERGADGTARPRRLKARTCMQLSLSTVVDATGSERNLSDAC